LPPGGGAVGTIPPTTGQGVTPGVTVPTVTEPVSHTHSLVVLNPRPDALVTAGPHPSHIPYSLEYIEPGIQNHKVEVYRSKDVRQTTYQDINPQDAGGFHLTVIGVRTPAYSR